MKKSRILVLLAMVLTATVLTACGGGGNVTYQNIVAQSNPYSMGTQSILIEASSQNPDAPSVKFKHEISPDDIELGQALVGKTVTSVTYHSETSITVVLEGNTKTAGGDGVYGTITVKHSGLESEGNSECTVNVRSPEIQVVSFSSSRKIADGVTTYSLTAKLGLPAGAFADNAAECITLADGVTGKFSVTRSDDGTLSLTVKNCNISNPSINLSADATTFGKSISVKLTLGGSATFQ